MKLVKRKKKKRENRGYCRNSGPYKPDRRTQIDTKGLFLWPPSPSPAKATARASKIHAATSFRAAAAMAISPTLVVKSLSSAKMRARTGKAVIESDTPMNTTN